MAKKTVLEGYKIEIVVPTITYAYGLSDQRSPDELRRLADNIKTAIRHHVGVDYPDARDIAVVQMLEHTCEHCNGLWTEQSDAYNGGCCDRDLLADPDLDPEERREIEARLAAKVPA